MEKSLTLLIDIKSKKAQDVLSFGLVRSCRFILFHKKRTTKIYLLVLFILTLCGSAKWHIILVLRALCDGGHMTSCCGHVFLHYRLPDV